jgi:hypothetical protein
MAVAGQKIGATLAGRPAEQLDALFDYFERAAAPTRRLLIFYRPAPDPVPERGSLGDRLFTLGARGVRCDLGRAAR